MVALKGFDDLFSFKRSHFRTVWKLFFDSLMNIYGELRYDVILLMSAIPAQSVMRHQVSTHLGQ